MIKVSLLLSLLSVAFATFGQRTASIVTSRDQPMGVVSFGPSVTDNGFTEGNHIDGYVRKYGAGQFIYPVGNNGFFRPFAAAAEGTVGAYYMSNPSTVTIGNSVTGGPFTVNKTDNVGKISSVEFWDINGSQPTRLTLTWSEVSNLASLLSGGDLSKLLLLGYDGSKWVEIPAIVDSEALLGGVSSTSRGSITTINPLVPDTYRIYSLGAAPDGALPVNLISFDAIKQEDRVRLVWSTSEEVNHDRFGVERRNRTNGWTNIGFVKSNAILGIQNYFFIDSSPFKGENLYRLRMEDLDGSYAYSSIKSLTLDSESDNILLYPNPVSDKLFIRSDNQFSISEVTLLNKLGGTVIHCKYLPTEGVDITGIAAGTYMVKVAQDNGLVSIHKVVIIN